MAKKVKKLEDVKPEETTEAIETPVEVEEKPTEVELPKVEFNEEIAPKGYSTIIPHIKEENPLKMKNGKVYKEIGNGYGMFLDNGSVFKI